MIQLRPMAQRTVPLYVRIPEEQKLWLDTIAKQNGVPISKVVAFILRKVGAPSQRTELKIGE